jgi:hypothetical protein
MYRIFGRDPQKFVPPYKEYLSYTDHDDRDNAEIIHKEAVNGKSFSMDCRIVLADGEVCLFYMHTKIIFNDNNIQIKHLNRQAPHSIKIIALLVHSSMHFMQRLHFS